MGRPKELQEAKHGEHHFKVNDCLMFKPAEGSLPYIGRVLRILVGSSAARGGAAAAGIRLQVSWYYRPEEAEGGRKSFYGQQELLASDHIDDGIPVASVLGCCRVHELDAYMQLQEDGQLSETDFYSRYLYKSGAKTFEPELVPVYCLCELPFNPDKPMSQCSVCTEWYHHECLKLQCGLDSLPAATTATAAIAADPVQQPLQRQQQHNSSRHWRCPVCSVVLHDTQQQDAQTERPAQSQNKSSSMVVRPPLSSS